MRLIDRQWAFEVGPDGAPGLRYDGISMVASVQIGGGPATTTLTIRNPGSALVQLLGQPNTLCRVLAGYRATGAVELARGSVVPSSVEDRRATQDPHVAFTVRDRGLILAGTPLTRSWSTTTAAEVLAWVAAQTGMPLDIVALGRPVVYARGYVVTGRPLTVLRSLAVDTRSEIAIVDGRIRLWPMGAAARPTADVWESSTGLLEVVAPAGSSEVRAVALLRPALRPGDIVQVVDARYAGPLTVRSLRHELDTDGPAWRTEITGRAAA